MNQKTRVQLSGMMFLEYFIWGTWFVAMGRYLSETLGASGVQIGTAYGNAWFGAIISPFFIGMIADRFFAAQKVNGVLHLIGGVLLYLLSTVQEVGQFSWLILLYSVVYMPTIGLTNSIVFKQSNDATKDFPQLRVVGTVAWIIANVIVGQMNWGNTSYIFLIPAVASIVFGVYSFTLPNTPANPSTDTSIYKILGLDALVMFKDRSYSIFFIGSVLLCIPLSFYYGFANVFLTSGAKLTQVETTMAVLGQGSEVLFLLALPFFLRVWGVRKILLVGMAAWVVRYLLFKFGYEGQSWMLYLGVLMHGICYDFFFATGQIYTDQKASPSIRNAAQGLITFATYGLGLTLGSWFSGQVAGNYTTNGVIDWSALWLVPAGIAAAVLVVFLVLFSESNKQTAQSAT